MDKKFTQNRPFVKKNINKVHLGEFIKNENNINELLNIFLTSEYDTILNEINSNKIFNFKDSQGETLINSVINNESINFNEDLKLEIIKKLVQKNVPVNSINQYNQNALHLASIKGYSRIITYLLDIKCDSTKIDNNGNGAVHYIIEKYLEECKKNDFYKPSNEEINYINSNNVKKVNQIVQQNIYLNLDKIINNESNKKLITDIETLLKNYKFFKILDIYKISNFYEKEIENILKNYNEIEQIEKIKNIIFKTKDDLDNLYNDTFNEEEIKYDKSFDFELNLEENIKKNTIDIKKNIKDILYYLDDIDNNIYNNDNNETIYDYYYYIVNFTYFMEYFDWLLEINSIGSNPIIYDNITFNKKNKELESNFSKEEFIIENSEKEVINLDIRNMLNAILNDLYIEDINHYYFSYFNLKKLNKTINITETFVDSTNKDIFNFYKLEIDEKKYLIKFYNDEGTTDYIKEYLKTNNADSITEEDINLNFKYSSIHNLVQIIMKNNELIKDYLKDINFDSFNIINFNLFYNKFISEKIISNINNLILLEKYIFDINFNDIFTHINFLDNILNKSDFNEKSKDLIDTFILPFFKDIQNNITKIKEQILTVRYYKKLLDDMYNNYYNILKNISTLTELFNKYQSIVNLKNYFYNKKNNLTEKIENMSNNFKFEYLLPINYQSYKIKFFNILTKNIYDVDFNNEDININVDLFINEIIPYNYDYNYNIFYLNDINKSIDYNDFNIIKDDDDDEIIENIDKKYDLKDILDKKKYKTGYNYYFIGKKEDEEDEEDDDEDDEDEDEDEDKEDEDKEDDEDEDKDNIKKKANSKLQIMNVLPYSYTTDLSEKKVKFIRGESIELNIRNNILILNNIKDYINLLINEIYKNISVSDTFDSIINITELEKYNLKEIEKIKKAFNYIKSNDILKKEFIFENLKKYIILIIKERINKETNVILEKFVELIKNETKSTLSLNLEILTEDNKIIREKIIKYIQSFKNDKLIKEYIDNTTNFTEIIDFILSDKNYNNINNKLILNKCYNKNNINEMIKLKYNYKILDINGNTIINRLIDQFNYYGIEKILESYDFLKTYKNYRNQTPLDYLYINMSNITSFYKIDEIQIRILNYSNSIKNEILTNNNYSNVSLIDSDDLIKNIILNSIYLFNEMIWVNLLEFPHGWSYELKEKLKTFLNLEELILIKTLKKEDNFMMYEFEKNNVNLKIDLLIEQLKKDIKDIENTILQLSNESKNNKILTKENIDKLIEDNENLKKNKEDELENLKKINIFEDNKDNFYKKFDELINFIDKFELLSTKNTISWEDYDNLIKVNLKSWYYKILKILNKKVEDDNNYVCNYNILILQLDYKVLDNDQFNILDGYFKIISNIYDDYQDLDHYEDSYYNQINFGIINILKINTINIIGFELISVINNYVINKYDKKIIINFSSSDKFIIIYESIEKLFFNSMIKKLSLQNPDKQYEEDEIFKNNIINIFYNIFNIKKNDEDNIELDNIIEFYKFISDNICYIVYNELTNMFLNLKKLSIYCKIHTLLK